MYNLPEMQAVNAAFWAAIRRELQRQGIESLPGSLDFARRPVPERIERDTLLTQVCGYPLQTIYRGQAALLGAPVYGAEHCAGATHAGVFVVHRDSAFAQLADLKRLQVRLQQPAFELGNEPAAAGDRRDRSGRALLRLHRGDAQPARQYRARGPPRGRRDLRRQRHLRVLLPASAAARRAHSRAGGNAAEPVDSVRDLDRDTRPAAGRLAQRTRCEASRDSTSGPRREPA
jgi:hypothetical protein